MIAQRLEQVLTLARELTPGEQALLVGHLVEEMGQRLALREARQRPLLDLRALSRTWERCPADTEREV